MTNLLPKKQKNICKKIQHIILSLCKFFGKCKTNQRHSSPFQLQKHRNEHHQKKRFWKAPFYMFVLGKNVETLSVFLWRISCFLLKRVNHIKMPCGKQIVWIEFTHVHKNTHTYSQHPSADDKISINVTTRQKYIYIFSMKTKRNGK